MNLKALEDRLNAEFPSRLADIRENNVVFIEEKRAKYKYPCFKGIKWYSCDGWTKLSPAVKGDVWGAVDRDGRVTLTGDNGALRLAIPIRASISGKALGVQETAKAKAVIFVDLTPALTENWELTLEARPDYRWTERPTLKLFDVVKVTIGSQVDPKMREALAKMAAEMPDMLKELKLREKAADGWRKPKTPSSSPPSPNRGSNSARPAPAIPASRSRITSSRPSFSPKVRPAFMSATPRRLRKPRFRSSSASSRRNTASPSISPSPSTTRNLPRRHKKRSLITTSLSSPTARAMAS